MISAKFSLFLTELQNLIPNSAICDLFWGIWSHDAPSQRSRSSRMMFLVCLLGNGFAERVLARVSLSINMIDIPVDITGILVDTRDPYFIRSRCIDSAINNGTPGPLKVAYELHRCAIPVFLPGLLDPVRSAFIVRDHELRMSPTFRPRW